VIPLVHLSKPVLVLVDIGAWAVFHSVSGYAVHRAPHRWFEHDTRLTRPRRWERGGRTYQRLGIRRWKDHLPEAGGLFRGGVSKRRIPAGEGGLQRFAAETRRAEWGHALCAACSVLFVLWNPLWIAAVMVGYGVAVNAPFIAVQRYNRLRVNRALGRRANRSTKAASSAAARSRTDRGTTGSSIP
jgi:glycosyl-4,4'-diaponeurosporenoate acyltransferase